MNRLNLSSGALLLALIAVSCSSTPETAVTQGGQLDTAMELEEEEEPPGRPGEKAADSNRLIFDDCSPGREARRYEGLVGESALVEFAWADKMGPAAEVKPPVRVNRIDPERVIVTFDPRVTNIELYTSVWTYSGHIEPNFDGTFGVDPCSATFEQGGW